MTFEDFARVHGLIVNNIIPYKSIRVPTEEAKNVLRKQGSNVENIKIMYTYEKRPELKQTLIF